MELDTVERVVAEFYRLVGTTSDDDALVERGEDEGDVAYLFLTRGCRAAQQYMLEVGYAGWRARSDALAWSGTDDTTGGRYSDLPTDFLRAYGDADHLSPLVEANGDRWGTLVRPDECQLYGDGLYFQGDQLWLLRGATPPTTLYLDYHYKHPLWDGDLDDDDIDFPMDARPLIPAFSADKAKYEDWLTGGPQMEARIAAALRDAKEDARKYARPSKQPRTLRKSVRYGNNW